MAVFKKRGDWWIDYRIGKRRYRESAGIGASHSLAKELLAKRLADRAERKHFPARVANAMLFEKVAERFWNLHGKHLLSNSWEWMLGVLPSENSAAEKVPQYSPKSLLGKFNGQKIGDIGTGEIQAFYNEVAARASSATADHYLTLLCAIFNKAKAWGDYYGDNPCTRVKRQRGNAHRLRFLSNDEIKSLYEVVHPSIYPILVAALNTGMRRGELLGLRWENVSLERSTVYILRSKSGKPREITITNQLADVLAGLGPRPDGPIFDIPVITLRRYFAKALKDARITGFRFHDLRHTFASHFIMRTNDLPTLQGLLGHATPAMTLRYAHLSKGHVQSAMAVFAASMPVKGPSPLPEGHQFGHGPKIESLSNH